MRPPEDGTWGVELSPGNLSGIVGTLQMNQADISLMLSVTLPRYHYIGYTSIYAQEGMLLISEKPSAQVDSLAIIRPFNRELEYLKLYHIYEIKDNSMLSYLVDQIGTMKTYREICIFYKRCKLDIHFPVNYINI